MVAYKGGRGGEEVLFSGVVTLPVDSTTNSV